MRREGSPSIAIRAHADENSVPFIEVYANATLDALVARDVKGLYKKALAGEIANFTGVSDPYEAPHTPEIEVRTDRDSVDESTAQILTYLEGQGLIG